MRIPNLACGEEKRSSSFFPFFAAAGGQQLKEQVFGSPFLSSSIFSSPHVPAMRSGTSLSFFAGPPFPSSQFYHAAASEQILRFPMFLFSAPSKAPAMPPEVFSQHPSFPSPSEIRHCLHAGDYRVSPARSP